MAWIHYKQPCKSEQEKTGRVNVVQGGSKELYFIGSCVACKAIYQVNCCVLQSALCCMHSQETGYKQDYVKWPTAQGCL